jgi:putative membrane protein
MPTTIGSQIDQNTFVLQVGDSNQSLVQRKLKQAELIERRKTFKISANSARYRIAEFRYKGSVIPAILIPGCITTLWSALWTILYFVANWRWLGVPNQLIGIISVVMGLLLVFRTNSSYDRFWSARLAWGALITHSRNLARFIWVGVKILDEKEKLEQLGALNLILAYCVAVKHHLRMEKGIDYEDLHHLVVHLPEFRNEMEAVPDHLPLDISYHLAAYVTKCRQTDRADIPTSGNMLTALSGMVDCLTNFERIRTTPVPIAYSIHLKQTLMLYLLTLPFQLLSTMGWVTIVVVFVASFTLLGIEAIGTEIENPFGYDENDLRMDVFCNELKRELELIKKKRMLDSKDWETPFCMSQPGIAEDVKKYQ